MSTQTKNSFSSEVDHFLLGLGEGGKGVHCHLRLALVGLGGLWDWRGVLLGLDTALCAPGGLVGPVLALMASARAA